MDYVVHNIAKNAFSKLYHCVSPVLGCTLSPNADNEYWNVVKLAEYDSEMRYIVILMFTITLFKKKQLKPSLTSNIEDVRKDGFMCKNLSSVTFSKIFMSCRHFISCKIPPGKMYLAHRGFARVVLAWFSLNMNVLSGGRTLLYFVPIEAWPWTFLFKYYRII